MDEVNKFIHFVKHQAEFHERQAQRFLSDERRSQLHDETVKTLRELLAFLEDLASRPPAIGRAGTGLSLSWSELQDLPDELVGELSITESDKLDFSITELIDRQGGVASLDRILVEVYRLTGEILKRQNLNARLYRMAQKGLIYSVAGRKGLYSTRELSEDELRELN